LQRRGIRPGDAVGLLMENQPRWGIAFLAIQNAGAVAVPLDLLHQPETLAKLIRHAECRFLISSTAFLPKLEQLQAALPCSLPALLVGEAQPGYESWDAQAGVAPARRHLPPVERSLDETAVIIYTSGTTGDPKGVTLTARSIYQNIVAGLHVVQTYADDHMLCVLPLYHVLALVANCMLPLHRGMRVTFLDSLDPQRILRTFQEEQITIFVCVPQFFYAAHRRIQQEIQQRSWAVRLLFGRLLSLSRFAKKRLGVNLGKLFFRSVHRRFGSQLRLFAVGGARFDPAIERSLRDLGFEFVQAYGMTETAALITLTPPQGSEVGSVGKPLPHIEVRIDRPDEHGVGEVLVKGNNVMQGYWKNPEASDAALIDGWLHTGDSGRFSPAGFLYLTGRLKDVIVLSSGKNVFPEELEHHYQTRCPEIREICVIGAPDETSGESRDKLHAVIVPDFEYLRSRQVVNAADMIRYVLENASQLLPPYKRVKSFEIRRDPLPRTTTRKLRRFEVESEILNRDRTPQPAAPQAETRPQSATEEKVFALIQQVKKNVAVNSEMSLELDLGFDSLERVEFLSNVQEAFGVHLDDDEAAAVLTVRDLVETLDERISSEHETQQEGALSWAEILSRPLKPEDAEQVRRVLAPKPIWESGLFLTAQCVLALFKILFRVKYRGLENLPQTYPFLICPNHLSYLDGFLLVTGLPYRAIKRLFFLGYSDYFRHGLAGFFGRRIKVIPVDADRRLRQALRLTAEGLKRRLVLAVFPEGERSIDGELKPFRKGPAILACEFRLPVVPAAVVGTYEAWARGSSRLRFLPVRMRFGKPIAAEPDESYEAFNQRLFRAVEALIEEEKRGS
jgi:long-chain acyl-CoA synthetase